MAGLLYSFLGKFMIIGCLGPHGFGSLRRHVLCGVQNTLECLNCSGFGAYGSGFRSPKLIKPKP